MAPSNTAPFVGALMYSFIVDVAFRTTMTQL